MGLKLRSTSTQFLLVFGPLAAGMIGILYVSQSFPNYTQDAGYAVLAIIFLPIAYLMGVANIQGPKFQHIENSIFDPITKTAYSICDFFVESPPEPGAPVNDVYPMSLYCKVCKLDIEKGVRTSEVLTETPKGKLFKQRCPKCSNVLDYKEKPVFKFGRWWYPYLVVTHLPVSFGKWESVFVHVFILPHPWKAFLGFERRKDGAVYMGEVITPGASTHLDSVLAPFRLDFVGTSVPVYLGVLSTYSIAKITEGWEDGMKELARVLSDMNKFIQEQEDHLYPKAQVEDLMGDVFPEVKVPGASRRTRATMKAREEEKKVE